MSKRLVLGGLLLAAGGPMLISEIAPLGAVATVAAVALLALPRIEAGGHPTERPLQPRRG